jgi:hypothetical protein
MRRNPERVAWAVLLSAFAAFCLVVVAVPIGGRWYVQNAHAKQDATVESLVGTIVVEPPVGAGPTPLSKGQSKTISEGTIIRVDETSEAFVTFFNHTLRLFPGTTIRLDRLRSPRYRVGVLPDTVQLSLVGGQVIVGTALGLEHNLDFRVRTLHGEFRLDADGSYILEARNERSEITVYRGHSEVAAAETVMQLEAGQRTQVDLNQPPRPATSAARELVTNGSFREPLTVGWRAFNDQGSDGGDVDGRVEIVVDEDRPAARFLRTGGHGNHCETVLEQTINRQLSEPITSLKVRAWVKVRYQSLSGGGYMSSEYPLMIRIRYRDFYDSETEWIQGFYYENVAGTPTMHGQEIPRDRWYPFESGNLLDILPVRPYRIISIQVYASGWDYDSLISDVHLIAE